MIKVFIISYLLIGLLFTFLFTRTEKMKKPLEDCDLLTYLILIIFCIFALPYYLCKELTYGLWRK